MHIDFQRVDENEAIRVKVPLHFINEEKSPAVKTAGVVITHVMNEIEVSCLPKDLPEFIEVDLANLAVGDIVHLSELKLPKGVELPELKLGKEHDVAVVVAKHGQGRSRRGSRRSATAAGRSAGRPRPPRRTREVIVAARRALAARRSCVADSLASMAGLRLIVGLGNPGRRTRADPAQRRVLVCRRARARRAARFGLESQAVRRDREGRDRRPDGVAAQAGHLHEPVAASRSPRRCATGRSSPRKCWSRTTSSTWRPAPRG